MQHPSFGIGDHGDKDVSFMIKNFKETVLYYLHQILLLLIGVFFGFLFFSFFADTVSPHVSFLVASGVILILGVYIARTRRQQLKEKSQGMMAVVATIAHELRTPLRTVLNHTQLTHLLPKLVDSYQQAEKAGLPVPFLQQGQLDELSRGLSVINREVHYANSIINSLLKNLAGLNQALLETEVLSMKHCVQTVLEEYPFQTDVERQLIKFDTLHDFNFLGDKHITKQIIVNLLSNALYYVHRAGKGDITIVFVQGKKHNQLIFTDTGEGIPKEFLPHIFNQFFTQKKRDVGTGLGLFFCKIAMQKMKGKIVCESEQGQYARFILTFPLLKEIE